MSGVTSGQAVATQPQTGRSRNVVMIVGVSVILALVAIFGWKIVDSGQGQVRSGLAPDFTLSLFEGGQLTLSELQGQVVVINFWASWCIPCRDETPLLERAWRQYRDREVVFVGVAYLDTEKESLAFMQEFDVTFPNGPDLGTLIADDYRISGVPETFFIAKDGRVADLEIGPLTEARLISTLERLLAE
jgi:cytochrome c biogenesis protein CcmG, thiol:disulfide interchange protein DsbE